MTPLRAEALKHVRPVVRLVFPSSEPESERMGQSHRHLRLCAALFELLIAAAGGAHTVHGDLFTYFDATDPGRCLAPDAMVRLGSPQLAPDSWKTWELGTPELAFEVLSPSDSPERWTFEEKLEHYRSLGVRELVVFHADAPVGTRLRAWDRIDDDLVERIVEVERTPCLTLGLHLVVAMITEGFACIRLARDPEGTQLVLLKDEQRDIAEAARDAEARARAAAEAARDAEARARAASEARVRELEAMLAAGSGGT